MHHVLRGYGTHRVEWRAERWRTERLIGFNLWNRRSEIPPGRCLWCLRPTPHGRRGYHPECKRMKDVFALGAHPAGHVPFAPIVCARCGAGSSCPDEGSRFDLDHRVPLSIAREMLGLAGWVRALQPENLQWLCRPCHKAKTAEDLRTLWRLRQAAEHPPPPPPPPPSPQRDLFFSTVRGHV